MLALTCDKCRRRFTPVTDELHVYLQASEGKRHALVPCPHCGKDNKVARERIAQALRFSPPASPESTPPST